MKLESKVTAIKEEKSYGTLHLSSPKFPFVKELKIGDIKECIIKTKVTSLRAADNWEIANKEAKVGDISVSVIITDITMHKPTGSKEKGMKY